MTMIKSKRYRLDKPIAFLDEFTVTAVDGMLSVTNGIDVSALIPVTDNEQQD